MRFCRSSSNPRNAVAALLLALAVTNACSEPLFDLPTSPTSDTTTSTTTTVTTATTQSFAGTLEVRGQRFYSFSVPTSRTVQLTLEQLQTGSGNPVAARLELGLGVPSGTGCALSSSVAAVAAEAPHIKESVAAGVYCARVADPGNLTEAVLFSVRIDFP